MMQTAGTRVRLWARIDGATALTVDAYEVEADGTETQVEDGTAMARVGASSLFYLDVVMSNTADLVAEATDGTTTVPCLGAEAFWLDAVYNAAKTAAQAGDEMDLTDAVLTEIGLLVVAADPLANPVPASYASGTAGYVLGRIQAPNLTWADPVAVGPVVRVYKGYDYKASLASALDFSADTWPDLTTATDIVFTIGTTEYTGEALSATQARLELTAAETSALSEGHGNIYAKAVFADGAVLLFEGQILVSNP